MPDAIQPSTTASDDDDFGGFPVASSATSSTLHLPGPSTPRPQAYSTPMPSPAVWVDVEDDQPTGGDRTVVRWRAIATVAVIAAAVLMVGFAVTTLTSRTPAPPAVRSAAVATSTTTTGVTRTATVTDTRTKQVVETATATSTATSTSVVTSTVTDTATVTSTAVATQTATVTATVTTTATATIN